MKNKVAIIGVGTQGSMIAFRNAVYGKEVTAYSRNLSSREHCAERIERFLEFYVQTGRLMQAEADQARARITYASTLEEACKDAYMVRRHLRLGFLFHGADSLHERILDGTQIRLIDWRP